MLKSFFLNLLILALFSFASSAASVKKIDPMEDREIAVQAEHQFSKKKSSALRNAFSKCVPQESISFPEQLSAELSKKIFSSKELEDLKACKPGSCKHNFLPYEVELLERIKDEEKLKQQFFAFYRNRAEGLTPMSPRYKNSRFSKAEGTTSFCQSPQLDQFLSSRPVEKAGYRLSVVQYDDRMRPTARLLQGLFYESELKENCYAEALIFSNHYDVDRIEVWGLSPDNKLQLVIRHRIDLLNSWWRRLQKPKLQEALEAAALRQMQSAVSCIESR